MKDAIVEAQDDRLREDRKIKMLGINVANSQATLEAAPDSLSAYQEASIQTTATTFTESAICQRSLAMRAVPIHLYIIPSFAHVGPEIIQIH